MKQTSKMITIGLLITVIILCLSFSMAITAAAGPAASTQAGPMGQPSGEEAGEQPFELFGDEDEFILLGSDDLIPAESESFEGESTEFF
ncbi:MAG: hypothetical protein LBB91_01820, partial [Clostridiales bacterium]|nr:hypothetical protein [Clostridiales bacterium]